MAKLAKLAKGSKKKRFIDRFQMSGNSGHRIKHLDKGPTDRFVDKAGQPNRK